MAAVILALAGLIFLLLKGAGLSLPGSEQNSDSNSAAAYNVEVRIDGAIYASWPLSEDGEYNIDSKYGKNHLSIKSGVATMTEADCPDGYCMQQTPLGNGGRSLICLPHHLIAELKISEENAADESGPDVDTVAS